MQQLQPSPWETVFLYKSQRLFRYLCAGYFLDYEICKMDRVVFCPATDHCLFFALDLSCGH